MGNLSTIQHPCPDHSLTELLIPSSPYSFKCYLCNKKLKRSAYQCYNCKFYIHKRCAEAPPSIPNHPLHPQHPLTLSHGIHRYFVCDGCGTHPLSGIAYACEECDFYVDFACALSALPWNDEEEVAVPAPAKVHYFGHEHSLMCFDGGLGTGDYCWMCKKEIRGEGCGCFVCKLFLHDRCFASTRPRTEYEGKVVAGKTSVLPVVIEHPLHWQHPLYLYIGSVPRQCHVCKSFCPSLTIREIYRCYVCDQCCFCLDETVLPK